MGKQILHYQTEYIVGEGVTGTVYQAVDITSGKHVLVKQINSYLVHSTPVIENLERQFKGLADLQHPGIAEFYAYTLQDKELYIVSEYIEGTRLSDLMYSGKESISEERVWHIFSQVLQAFSYAHDKNIYHHSISPDCIVINASDQVKILGFGLSDLFADLETGLPVPDIKMGSINYQSPEQVYGKRADARSDIYSLGVILFELISRQNPYPSVLSTYEIQTKIVNDTLPLIKLYTPDFSQSYRMQEIIDKATAKNPAYRFQHCAQMQELFQEERDEREALLLSQMMQHVAGNSQTPTQNIYENSTIELARKKTYWKVGVQAFLIIAFLATAMIFTGTIIDVSGETAIADEKKTKSDATAVVTQKALAAPKRSEKVPVQKKEVTVKKNNSSPDIPTRQIAPRVITGESELASAGMAVLPEKRTRIFTANDLQVRLNHFYEALRSKNINQVEGYYAPRLTRFFNEYGVEEEKLKELIERAWDRTPDERHTILWDTFRYYRDEKGNYIMDFYMNYDYLREERTAWKTRRIYTMIKMDKDLRIYYMDGE